MVDDFNTVNHEIKKYNNLKNEKSPYLLEHASNPVDWFPWSIKAFEKARNEDKPIFLSIGYSSCHWCHVMARESFEDHEVAGLLNRAFINIKVDREERPDIDKIYMDICQMLTGSGGWPLSIIMTPDKKPFFAATYIPKESKYGHTGMMDLLKRISEIWQNQRDKATRSAEDIADALNRLSQKTATNKLDISILESTYNNLSNFFDDENGGFGQSPKFPSPHNLIFLLRYWKRTKEDRALFMVEKTLQAMNMGGIWDHVGFGFHRYSTDPQWLLPHFEKMLYDQAMLSMAYTDAFLVTKKSAYKRTAEQIFTYILRDMTSRDGGFFTAEDADSEGEEGKYYVWTYDEIIQAVDHDDLFFIQDIFNIKKDGNFRDEATSKSTGKNILFFKDTPEKLAERHKLSMKELFNRIESIRAKLYDFRSKRIRPLMDDKILTDWNGLMISSLARAAQAFDQDIYMDAAIRANDFILNNNFLAGKGLFHSYGSDKNSILGNLDDYSFLIMGLTDLYEATFDASHLKNAVLLMEILINKFWDEDSGGFFFTHKENTDVIARMKYSSDGAIPSGNSISMFNLLRLAGFTERQDLADKALRLGESFFSDIAKNPDFHTSFVAAFDFFFGPSHEVVITGEENSIHTKNMIKTLREKFVPNKIVIFKPYGQEDPEIQDIAKYINGYNMINKKPTAYVCTGHNCKLPTNSIEEMVRSLE